MFGELLRLPGTRGGRGKNEKKHRKEKGGHQVRAEPQERPEEGSLAGYWVFTVLRTRLNSENPARDGEFCVLLC